jgi:predicted aconitase
MRLSDTEQRMLAGEMGEPRRFALEQQLAVGRFFDADGFQPVTQAHLLADGEALGEAGVRLLEGFAAAPEEHRRVLIPTVTDPRGVDPKACNVLNQPRGSLEREQRIVAALEAMGALMTNTCINYQTVLPPVLGEHLAFGDTGSVIYANSVAGARSNFEGGAAALWAALTGRVPRYGYHRAEQRRATRAFAVATPLTTLSDWGALGGVIGRRLQSYWQVPAITGVETAPGSDALKHLGAALASYGSVGMFHMVGATPEAPDPDTAFGGPAPDPEPITRAHIEDFYAGFARADDTLDVVVFAAPQLSLFELQSLARILAGRRVARPLLAAVPPETVRAAERMGLAETIEAAGGTLLEGICFYQSYAREIGEANGWRRLATNSAKLANIIGGYGYEPVLLPMERCVEAAVRGSLP